MGRTSNAGNIQRNRDITYLESVAGGPRGQVAAADLRVFTQARRAGLSRRAARNRVRAINRRRAGG
jgi:hypothetical protein